MATNVAGAGKPSPQEPNPNSKSAGAVKGASTTDNKPPSASGKPPSTSGKATSASPAKSTEPDASKSPAKSKTGFNELNDLKKIGKYEIIKKIGQGGMGAVFLAKDTQLKRQEPLPVG